MRDYSNSPDILFWDLRAAAVERCLSRNSAQLMWEAFSLSKHQTSPSRNVSLSLQRMDPWQRFCTAASERGIHLELNSNFSKRDAQLRLYLLFVSFRNCESSWKLNFNPKLESWTWWTYARVKMLETTIAIKNAFFDRFELIDNFINFTFDISKRGELKNCLTSRRSDVKW